jgi:hypothetical protein
MKESEKTIDHKGAIRDLESNIAELTTELAELQAEVDSETAKLALLNAAVRGRP